MWLRLGGGGICAVEEERTLESVARWGERKSWKRI